MSNLYIDTVQVVGGVLTPIIAILLLVIINNMVKLSTAKIDERKMKMKLRPEFQVRLHEVPNPTMWGVEISRNGEVLEDVGIDKL